MPVLSTRSHSGLIPACRNCGIEYSATGTPLSPRRSKTQGHATRPAASKPTTSRRFGSSSRLLLVAKSLFHSGSQAPTWEPPFPKLPLRGTFKPRDPPQITPSDHIEHTLPLLYSSTLTLLHPPLLFEIIPPPRGHMVRLHGSVRIRTSPRPRNHLRPSEAYQPFRNNSQKAVPICSFLSVKTRRDDNTNPNRVAGPEVRRRPRLGDALLFQPCYPEDALWMRINPKNNGFCLKRSRKYFTLVTDSTSRRNDIALSIDFFVGNFNHAKKLS